MEVKLIVVGSSPAWPNPGGAQSGYLVESDGRRLLLDCGAGVLARLREQSPWPQVDAIAVTHFHLDHFADLVPWVWGALFGPGREVAKPELWLPPGGAAQLDHLSTHFGTPEMFERAFHLHEYVSREPFSAAGLEVTPVEVLHYTIETYGMRVGNGRRTLGYSGDSGPCPPLAEIARGADLFLCEATLGAPELDDQPRGHLTIDEALDAFRAGGAARLLLTHRPDELRVDEGLELAYDGLELVLA